MSFVGDYVQNLSNLLQNDVYDPLGKGESVAAHLLVGGALPGGPGSSADPASSSGGGKIEKGEQKIGKAGGILGGGKDAAPSIQQDINKYMAPYMTELTSLGPEYAKEMAFLKPYMESNPGAGTQAAVAQEYGGSGVKDITAPTPQGMALGEASAQNAAAIEGFKPGFGDLAAGAKAQEQTTSYADVLNAALTGQKNLLLGYNPPQFGSLNTLEAGFSPQTQTLLNELATSQGGGSNTGVTPINAAATAPQPANSSGSVNNLGVSTPGTTTSTTIPSSNPYASNNLTNPPTKDPGS